MPLNQSYNKSYQLFGLIDTMAMTPTVDNLNISTNEMRHNTEIFLLRESCSSHQSVDKSQGSGFADKGARQRAGGSGIFIFSCLDTCIYSHTCR